MKRYNHAVTIAFECLSDNRDGPTDTEYRQGLIDRIAEIDAEPGGWAQVNVEAPFDTMDLRPEDGDEWDTDDEEEVE